MNNGEFVRVVAHIDGHNLFNHITSKKNLFAAWREFRAGKKNKKDVLEFSFDLEENLLLLHSQLRSEVYAHGSYEDFFVSDPKRRHIHKASVRDRVLHHAIHRVLYPVYERIFISDSFSSRVGKGTHAGVRRFEQLARRQSDGNSKTVWILKCDVRKFFDTIDHEILLKILRDKLKEWRLIKLLAIIIGSFHNVSDKGLPLGNLTSQLFANIYLNTLDDFVKHDLEILGYVRYADDLLFISTRRFELESLRTTVSIFLKGRLLLELHPTKTILRKWTSGIDVLGFTSFPYYRLLRARTARRAVRRVTPENLPSYLGMLKHCSGHGIYKLLT